MAQPADDTRGVTTPLPRLVVLDCNKMLWKHHLEGSFDQKEREAADTWFYDAEWVTMFVRTCHRKGIVVAIATMLHDAHDGIPKSTLNSMIGTNYYDTASLMCVHHDYEHWVGGSRLIAEIFKRHAHLDLDELGVLVEAWMPLASVKLNKNDHLARIITRYNNTHPATAITHPSHVWLFDDAHSNTIDANRNGYVGITVMQTFGFSRAWFNYATSTPYCMEISISKDALLRFLRHIELDSVIDAFTLATDDDDDFIV